MSLDLNILKTIVSNKKYALDFTTECDAKLFSPEVWNFASLVTNYVKTHKNVPTLRILTEKLGTKSNNDKLIENVKKIWGQIDSIEYNENEYLHDLEKLKNRFAEKQILSIKDKLSNLEPGSMDLEKTILEIQKTVKAVKDVGNKKTYERKTLKEALPAFTEAFNAKKNNPNIETGIKTYYSFLDYSCNGLKPADFLIVAGESGFGKSLFLNNISLQIWLQNNTMTQSNGPGKNVVFFSLEMPYEDCFNRVLARLTNVPVRKIENASLTKEEFQRVKQALEFINNYPYNFEIIDIDNVCANDLDAILDDISYQIDAAAFDYLGIMNTNHESNEDDWLKQGQVAREVRGIGRKRQIPVLSAAQLNRKNPNKTSEENIGLNRLARSGTIATHATTIIQIENRVKEEYYDDMLLHIIKQRKGPKIKGRLSKNLGCATLLDIPMDYDQGNGMFTEVNDIFEELEELEDL